MHRAAVSILICFRAEQAENGRVLARAVQVGNVGWAEADTVGVMTLMRSRSHALDRAHSDIRPSNYSYKRLSRARIRRRGQSELAGVLAEANAGWLSRDAGGQPLCHHLDGA